MKTLFFSVFATALLIVGGCKQTATVDTEAEKANVKTVMDQYMQVFSTEDMNMFSKIMAHDGDMVNFGTDAAERWVGYDALEKAVEQQFAAFDNTKVVTKDQVIHVNSTGNTAWVSEVGDMSTTIDSQQVALNGMRFTGVLEKRDGNWVIVQFHMSVPVQGQAADY